MMDRTYFHTILFRIAALWNIVLALPYLVQTFLGKTAFSGAALMYYQGFLLSVVLFGIGYYIVSRDLSRNHAIVLLGAIGKILVFAAFLVNHLAGHLPLYLVFIAGGDLLFALLFLRFLVAMRRETTHSLRSGSNPTNPAK